MMSLAAFTDYFALHPVLAYVILFLGSYFEILIGTGFFVYGEIFFFGGAILAGAGVLNIWLVYLVCVLGGILGDSSSFLIGWRWGHPFVKRHFKRSNRYLTPHTYAKTRKLLRKHGPKAVFIARLLGPFAWVTPFFVGTMRMPYRTFLLYNIPGVIIGIGEFMLIGYLFGYASVRVLAMLGEYAIMASVAVGVALLGYFIWRHFREARTA